LPVKAAVHSDPEADHMPRHERRHTPRLQVLNRIHGRLASLPVRLTLRDMGPRGFSVESAVAFPCGARRLFLFTTAAGLEVIIEGAVVYSRPHEGDESLHTTGFRFVHSRLTNTGADIDLLLDALTGVEEAEPVGTGE
jgi:hypothetical protein